MKGEIETERENNESVEGYFLDFTCHDNLVYLEIGGVLIIEKQFLCWFLIIFLSLVHVEI